MRIPNKYHYKSDIGVTIYYIFVVCCLSITLYMYINKGVIGLDDEKLKTLSFILNNEYTLCDDLRKKGISTVSLKMPMLRGSKFYITGEDGRKWKTQWYDSSIINTIYTFNIKIEDKWCYLNGVNINEKNKKMIPGEMIGLIEYNTMNAVEIYIQEIKDENKYKKAWRNPLAENKQQPFF